MSWHKLIPAPHIPLLLTMLLFLMLSGFGGLRYEGFLSGQVVLNLFIDNAFLLVAAIGVGFVILSGGIDLSVGAVMALATVICAQLSGQLGWPIWLVIPLVLAGGALFGALQGWYIERFELQAFIVTLAGMFLARGLCFMISVDALPITDPHYVAIAEAHIPLGTELFITPGVLIALAVLILAIHLANNTAFGRHVYAIGGNTDAARLMGLPVASTRIRVYALSGFCAALAGVLLTFYMLSGHGQHAQGLELDAIAAAVIGGILLSGGTGYILGTLFGVLILGLIHTLIAFDGSLSSWWAKIATGVLLCIFCLLQRGNARLQPLTTPGQPQRSGPR